VYRRKTAGAGVIYSGEIAAAGTVTSREIYWGARNNAGTADLFSASQWGAMGIGKSMTTTQAGQFSAALKLLWETCTGLSLP
jgi:hypothetical protein